MFGQFASHKHLHKIDFEGLCIICSWYNNNSSLLYWIGIGLGGESLRSQFGNSLFYLKNGSNKIEIKIKL